MGQYNRLTGNLMSFIESFKRIFYDLVSMYMLMSFLLPLEVKLGGRFGFTEF